MLQSAGASIPWPTTMTGSRLGMPRSCWMVASDVSYGAFPEMVVADLALRVHEVEGGQ